LTTERAPLVNLRPVPNVILVMRLCGAFVVIVPVTVCALAACSSPPPPPAVPPALRNGCNVLKTWEGLLDGAVPTGGIADVIADAAKPSPDLSGLLTNWEHDASDGATYDLPADEMMIDGECDTAGVLNAIPGVTVTQR
jgi:hypothetical protein